MLIGLCGVAGCGKNTVASILAEHRGFKEFAFADPLYEAVSVVTGMPVEWLKDRDNKEAVISWVGKSPRYLLQTLGTEWGRDTVKQSLWVDAAMQRTKGVEKAVITDVRFNNEAAAIREAGGKVYLIVRPGWRCLAAETASHPSEEGISIGLIDGFLSNSGDLDHLRTEVLAAII